MSDRDPTNDSRATTSGLALGGAVLFVRDVERVARFYEVLTPLRIVHADDVHAVLEGGAVQLVVHAIPHPGDAGSDATAPIAREDSYVKPFFLVSSLAGVRSRIESLGGYLFAPEREFTARGFRACDGVDPEGNVIQFRETERDGG